MDLDGEDAAERRAVVLHLHVGGRAAEFAAEAVAVHHAAADRVSAPEQMVGVLHAAFGQRRAHRAARSAGAVDHHARHRVHLEVAARLGRLEHAEVAGTARAEAEIVADLDPARAQPALQDAHDEILGRGFRKVVVETTDLHAVDAGSTQQFELFAQRSQARGRLIRGEELARMRLEGHHARGQPAPLRGVEQPHEHRLMAAMNAVEIADGQCDRRIGDGG